MRIVFMGTPDFAVPSLAILIEAGYEVVAVVTAPDRPAGRGRTLQPSPIKKYAVEQDIPVLQPEKLRDPEFIDQLEALKPDLMVVVAFRMLPEVVWRIPSIGTFNLHASLLPDYRGAAPINWVLINGEKRSGATTFLIDKEIDTGNILLQKETDIPEDWSAGDLHDHLMELGAGLVLETVLGLEKDNLKAHPQDDSRFRHKAPKIFKEDCRIDWNQPARRVYNFIRGLSPYPAAWTLLEELNVKVFTARLSGEKTDAAPGTLSADPDTGVLKVATADEWLHIEALQLAGKKRLPSREFLNGYKGSLTHLS